MFEEHKTSMGEVMLICEMSNEHLYNTIAMFSKKLYGIRRTMELKHPNKMLGLINPNFSTESVQENAKLYVMETYKKLQPYVLEAVVRDLTNYTPPTARGEATISSLLRLAFDREAQAAKITTYEDEFEKLLSAGADVEI